MNPQIRQSLIPQTAFVHYEMSKSLEMFIQYQRFFSHILVEQKQNICRIFLAISSGFDIMVLSSLIFRKGLESCLNFFILM